MAHKRASVGTGEANTVGGRGEAAGTAVQSRRDADPPLWLPNWRRRAVMSVPGTPVRVVSQGQRDEPSSSKNSDIPSPESDKCREEQDVPESEGNASEAICMVCEKEIVKNTDKMDGEDAVYCEGECKGWLHRCCAGLTTTNFVTIL